ncbi:peptidoglycan DD-metalloendopeptidase family protein [Pseudoxanthomonas sp. z9]|uniref:peptidoglycan DD-metalloendopeptidase family protein n=1 Tax=Pseudoxanthomonas sp. z9 TaxID=2584942 RepID=UPI00201D3AEE|nr:peptidoglycan DD-metalloendopeptidase family protein [Pseudoxanthomonas sp. z9]MCL6713817.1 M23 family metallopeptidase [Pseudomonas sp. R2.Fl]
MNPALRTSLLCLAAATLLAGAVPGEAARLYRWKDKHGYTQYGDKPPEAGELVDASVDVLRFHNTPSAQVRLRLERSGLRYQAWADNLLHGPVEVRLGFKRNSNVAAQPALPATAVVPARSSVMVASISMRDPLRGGDFELALDSLPGDPAAHGQDYEYRLPFEYGRVRVDQGPGGGFSHNDAQNLYAIDFAVPVGTPILAAREGMVMQVESDFDKAGLNRERFGGRANFIRIVHGDGSMAVYAHLKPEGVQVREGQYVRKGQRIGLSGNTGFSTAPHLHFVVQVNRGMALESIPFRMFGPLGQLQFPSQHAGSGPIGLPAGTAPAGAPNPL